MGEREQFELGVAAPKPTSSQRVGQFLALFAAAASGYCSGASWPAIFIAAVALLIVGDRGQHRVCIENPGPSRWELVVALSIGLHLLTNLFFTGLAFGIGRSMRIAWVDAWDPGPDTWSDLVWWITYDIAIVTVGAMASRVRLRNGD